MGQKKSSEAKNGIFCCSGRKLGVFLNLLDELNKNLQKKKKKIFDFFTGVPLCKKIFSENFYTATFSVSSRLGKTPKLCPEPQKMRFSIGNMLSRVL